MLQLLQNLSPNPRNACRLLRCMIQHTVFWASDFPICVLNASCERFELAPTCQDLVTLQQRRQTWLQLLLLLLRLLLLHQRSRNSISKARLTLTRLISQLFAQALLTGVRPAVACLCLSLSLYCSPTLSLSLFTLLLIACSDRTIRAAFACQSSTEKLPGTACERLIKILLYAESHKRLQSWSRSLSQGRNCGFTPLIMLIMPVADRDFDIFLL